MINDFLMDREQIILIYRENDPERDVLRIGPTQRDRVIWREFAARTAPDCARAGCFDGLARRRFPAELYVI